MLEVLTVEPDPEGWRSLEGTGLRARVAGTTYDVEGLTYSDARANMQREGPEADGRIVDATTYWQMSWGYTTQPGTAECRSTQVWVTIDVITTLPRWIDRDRAISRDAGSRWVSHLRYLRAHEQGHVEIAVDQAGLLEKALRDLERSDCQGLSREANRVAEQHRTRLRARQVDFDRVAGRGR